MSSSKRSLYKYKGLERLTPRLAKKLSRLFYNHIVKMLKLKDPKGLSSIIEVSPTPALYVRRWMSDFNPNGVTPFYDSLDRVPHDVLEAVEEAHFRYHIKPTAKYLKVCGADPAVFSEDSIDYVVRVSPGEGFHVTYDFKFSGCARGVDCGCDVLFEVDCYGGIEVYRQFVTTLKAACQHVTTLYDCFYCKKYEECKKPQRKRRLKACAGYQPVFEAAGV